MVSFSQLPSVHNASALLAPLHALAARRRELETAPVGRFVHGVTDYTITRFRFVAPMPAGRSGWDYFAGVHGDEPAGCHALVRFSHRACRRSQGRAAGYDLSVYPVVNPTGLEDRTRTNRAGRETSTASSGAAPPSPRSSSLKTNCAPVASTA